MAKRQARDINAAFEAYLATLGRIPDAAEADTLATAFSYGALTADFGKDPDIERVEYGLAAATPSGQAFIAGYGFEVAEIEAGRAPEPEPEPEPDAGGGGGKQPVKEAEEA